MSNKSPRELHLEQLLRGAAACVQDFDSGLICIRMHFYGPQVRSMLFEMRSIGYHLVSVLHVEHDLCSESGREFWWAKED